MFFYQISYKVRGTLTAEDTESTEVFNLAVAEDTGGAIKGHRIDIAKWTMKEAYRFGIKPVKVYVLQTPSQNSRNQA